MKVGVKASSWMVRTLSVPRSKRRCCARIQSIQFDWGCKAARACLIGVLVGALMADERILAWQRQIARVAVSRDFAVLGSRSDDNPDFKMLVQPNFAGSRPDTAMTRGSVRPLPSHRQRELLAGAADLPLAGSDRLATDRRRRSRPSGWIRRRVPVRGLDTPAGSMPTDSAPSSNLHPLRRQRRGHRAGSGVAVGYEPDLRRSMANEAVTACSTQPRDALSTRSYEEADAIAAVRASPASNLL